MAFSEKLKEKRAASGLTQTELAKRTGVTARTIQNYELGTRRPGNMVIVQRIAEALGIDLPEDDEYDTLGGMILDSLSAVPEDGSTPALDIAGLHIEVQEIKDRRIEWAVVSKLGQSESAEQEK